ncbi:MAG TPA: CPBP family glutamic-type intramembrane protease, partial [Polyangiaceae bacterium]|nr:CPBP family glutamic-type intramembrane protease [Polyangiaceae bacterium]
GHELRWHRFAWVALEAVFYAVAMRFVAAYVVGRLHLDGGAPSPIIRDRLAGVVMSLGAGFYEEIAFRVVLFGLGLKIVRLLFLPASPGKSWLVMLGWALAASAVFSGWHYVGDLGDTFDLRSFVFRWVCGMAFSAIYAFRGFAPAVWTHALYDLWVLVL